MQLNPLAELHTWSIPGAAALGGLVVGILVRRTVLPMLARAAAKSAWKYDDALVYAVNRPVVIWFVLLGLRLAVKLLPLANRTDAIIGTIIMVLGIMSVSWAAARFAVAALRNDTTTGTLPNVSLLANIARVSIFAIGLLIVLQALGISIGPYVAALGVGGLAVGLALQDTLANFFAGIRILAARRIRAGDFVRLDSGDEGVVVDISWGQTAIRQPSNNLVIVPNSKLANAIATNFTLPSEPQNVVVQVGVAYGSDLERVEAVTLAVARDIQQSVPEAVATFEPALRFKEFGESSVNFFVVLQAHSYPDRWAPVSAFIKRLHARYASEGIEIPFPVRTVITKSS